MSRYVVETKRSYRSREVNLQEPRVVDVEFLDYVTKYGPTVKSRLQDRIEL